MKTTVIVEITEPFADDPFRVPVTVGVKAIAEWDGVTLDSIRVLSAEYHSIPEVFQKSEQWKDKHPGSRCLIGRVLQAKVREALAPMAQWRKS